ncbi:hypothetical protein [Streptomyces sp. AF1A]|jgi:hypothetical protein|uniref:hypothetical protein n=1 Tax=Streptomyces sp. AF1A TaxID=3394350 RepID=UPI0039BD475A
MGWGNAREQRIREQHTDEQGRRTGPALWSATDLGAAASVGGAQLPAAGLLWWIDAATTKDDYGAGSGGALGALCVLLFAPLLLPLLGMVVTFALTLPSVVLARLAVRRLGGPAWVWHLLAPAAPAAVWGALTAPLWPLGTSVPVLAALGLLPTLWVGLARRRAWRPWGVWWRAALGSAVLFAAALGGGILATETGLIQQYEPPKLSTGRLAGVWRGPNGAELRLSADGRARAVRLPAEPLGDDWLEKDFVTCEGSGDWRAEHRTDLGRDGIRLRLDGDCGEDTDWSFGGSEDAPELFVLFGDPDAGTLRILRPAEGGSAPG